MGKYLTPRQGGKCIRGCGLYRINACTCNLFLTVQSCRLIHVHSMRFTGDGGEIDGPIADVKDDVATEKVADQQDHFRVQLVHCHRPD